MNGRCCICRAEGPVTGYTEHCGECDAAKARYEQAKIDVLGVAGAFVECDCPDDLKRTLVGAVQEYHRARKAFDARLLLRTARSVPCPR